MLVPSRALYACNRTHTHTRTRTLTTHPHTLTTHTQTHSPFQVLILQFKILFHTARQVHEPFSSCLNLWDVEGSDNIEHTERPCTYQYCASIEVVHGLSRFPVLGSLLLAMWSSMNDSLLIYNLANLDISATVMIAVGASIVCM